jgi:hypothetical protein
VEAVETAGNVCFKVLHQAAEEFEEQTEIPLVYFGKHHLDLETGHAMGTENIEDKFKQVKLTPKEMKEARGVVREVFRLFSGMCEDYYNYAPKGILAARQQQQEKKNKNKNNKRTAKQKAGAGQLMS